MLKVSTQAIWSMLAERSPYIWGRATFAIVSVVA
jgi:hypothetical protein